MAKGIKRHLAREYRDWEHIQSHELKKLNLSMKHLYVNVLAYLLITVIEFILAYTSKSQTLRADALNNLSGIISTAMLMFGIHIAKDINDDDIAGIPLPDIPLTKLGNDQRIQFTRFRYETIFTLVTSVIMIVIATNVITSGIMNFFNGHHTVPTNGALVGSIIATIIMLAVWIYNRRAGKKLSNAALMASAQDSLSDAITSIGTFISVGGAILFDIRWLDGVASIVVGLFIMYSGIKIFFESSLNLADYFDPKLELKFRNEVSSFTGISRVEELKAHYNGSLITVDVVAVINANMTVLESYRLAEKIEDLLRHKYGVIDTDVSFIPSDESITK